MFKLRKKKKISKTMGYGDEETKATFTVKQQQFTLSKIINDNDKMTGV